MPGASTFYADDVSIAIYLLQLLLVQVQVPAALMEVRSSWLRETLSPETMI